MIQQNQTNSKRSYHLTTMTSSTASFNKRRNISTSLDNAILFSPSCCSTPHHEPEETKEKISKAATCPHLILDDSIVKQRWEQEESHRLECLKGAPCLPSLDDDNDYVFGCRVVPTRRPFSLKPSFKRVPISNSSSWWSDDDEEDRNDDYSIISEGSCK